MTDQCKYCTYRGDMIACTAAECHKHDDWYAVEIRKRNDQLTEALKAAMDYIKQCPCDPDIYPDQLEAWNKLQSLSVEVLLGE